MATLSELQADVAAEDTVVASVLVLINGLAAQIKALQPPTPATTALALAITSKASLLAKAVVANTK